MTPPHISAESLLQHQGWLFGLVRKLVRDDFTADDMVQATFTDAIADPSAGKTNLPAWLASTARRIVAQDWRSTTRRKNREDRFGVSDEAVLKHSAELSELSQVTNSALHDLPENERVVLMLRHMQGWKPQAIAEELGIPLEVVYRHAERGCHKLRGRLKNSYGKEWQASCLAILVFPNLHKSISLTTLATGLAASLAVVAAGIWGFSTMGAKPNNLALAEGPPSMAAEILEDFPFNASLAMRPDRMNLAGPSTDSLEVRMQMLAPDGMPYAGGWATVNWMNDRDDQPQGLTDSDGFLSLEIPADAEEVNIEFGAVNLFGKKIYPTESLLSERLTLQLVKGTIPVSFQTLLEEEGQSLSFQGGNTMLGFHEWTGFGQTDAHGLAEALLPAPGRYSAKSTQPVPGWHRSQIYVEQEGFPFPIPVIFRAATEIRLVVKDRVGGSLIDHASFFVTTPGEQPGSYAYHKPIAELPSSRGRLSILASELPSPSTLIQISADGYAGTFVQFLGPQPEDILVELSPIEWVPSILLCGQADIQFSSLFLYEDYGAFSYPSSSGGNNNQNWGPRAKRELDINPEGQFLLPRTLDGSGGSFMLVASDSQGHKWIAKGLSAPDREGTNLEFTLTPPANGHTVVKITGARPASTSVSYKSYIGGPSNPDISDVVPDENLELHYTTRPGDRIEVSYWTKNLTFKLERWLPAGEDSATFQTEIPQGTATLEGQFYGPEGLFLPDSTVVAFRFVPEQTNSVDESRNLDTLTVWGRVKDGQAILENCPPGNYQYIASPDFGRWEQSVNTGVPFVVHYPATNNFTVQVLNESGSKTLGAQFILSNIQRTPQRPRALGDSNRGSGFLYHAFPQDLDQSHLLVLAQGYQPQSIADLLPDQIQRIFLKKGRYLRIHLDGLGMTHQEGHRWICDAWGDANDPRQPLIHMVGQVIHMTGAPLEAVHFLELDENDVQTGVVIHVDSTGTAELEE